MKLLFVCSVNLNRSPTAERIFKDEYETKSAGIDPMARVVVTEKDIEWADIVFVMEEWQKEEIIETFPKVKRVISLDIPDQFYYMEPELIYLLRKRVKKWLS